MRGGARGQSGQGGGAGGGGMGGKVSFTADHLRAGIINLDTNNGELSLNVAVLEIGAQGTTLNGNNSLASGAAVSVDTLLLTNDQAFILSDCLPGEIAVNTFRMDGDTLHIDGSGHPFIDSLLFNNFVLAGTQANTINTIGDYTLNRVISGTGGLTKAGGGTLTLSDANTYSGGTDFGAGQLHAAHNSALGSGPLTFNGGDTLLVDGGLTLNNDIVLAQEGKVEISAGNAMLTGAVSGSAGLTKLGAGRLILVGANTYTGITTVRAGTLALNSPGDISPFLTIYDGAEFDTSGGAVPVLSQLDIRGANAVYSGDLNARNASLNFYLPAGTAAGGTMLAVSGTADITGSTVNVGIDGAGTPLQAGNSVTLIDAASLAGAPRNAVADGQGMQGVTMLYDFDIVADSANDRLLAVFSSPGPSVNLQSKALSEGFISGAVLVNQGADILAGQGMSNAVAGAKSGPAREDSLLNGFGAVSGGRVRYNTGSHVDVSGFSLITGLSAGGDTAAGRSDFGRFL
jgi:autotransporter-associated beta strand protein